MITIDEFDEILKKVNEKLAGDGIYNAVSRDDADACFFKHLRPCVKYGLDDNVRVSFDVLSFKYPYLDKKDMEKVVEFEARMLLKD